MVLVLRYTLVSSYTTRWVNTAYAQLIRRVWNLRMCCLHLAQILSLPPNPLAFCFLISHALLFAIYRDFNWISSTFYHPIDPISRAVPSRSLPPFAISLGDFTNLKWKWECIWLEFDLSYRSDRPTSRSSNYCYWQLTEPMWRANFVWLGNGITQNVLIELGKDQ